MLRVGFSLLIIISVIDDNLAQSFLPKLVYPQPLPQLYLSRQADQQQPNLSDHQNVQSKVLNKETEQTFSTPTGINLDPPLSNKNVSELIINNAEPINNDTVQLQNVMKKTDSIMVGPKFGLEYDRALEAIIAIAIRLETLLSQTDLKKSRNFLISPLSMAIAVGQLMLGAREPFRSNLYDLVVFKNHSDAFTRKLRKGEENIELVYRDLHTQLGMLMKNLEDEGGRDGAYTLRTASIMYAQRGVGIRQSYRYDVKRYYGTDIEELDFQSDPFRSRRIVNEWVQRSTNNLIKELLSGPLPKNTAAILANAVYFKADWEVPFASEINRKGLFKTSPTESVDVTYMLGEFNNYEYVENKQLGCRMVKIPYMNDDVAMYIVLPNPRHGRNEYDINGFVKELKMEDFDELTNSVTKRKVMMILPKMSLSSVVTLSEPLKRYHHIKQHENIRGAIPTKFLNFDLGNMFENPINTLNNVYQQMTLSVNEKGTEAAAISAGIFDYIMDAERFRVDRPFLFFIRHEMTKAILFWGTIVDPSEARAF